MYPTVFIILGVAGACGVGAYLFARSRRQAEICHTDCPNCGKRLGYKAKQVGHPAACPRCGERLLLPKQQKPRDG